MKDAERGELEEVQRLLYDRLKVGVIYKDIKGYIALIWGACMGNPRVVTMLLEIGSNVATKNWDGRIALMRAAYGGYTEIVTVF